MADPHDTENWRPVVGYEGVYEVSDLGRVRTLARLIERKSGGRWGTGYTRHVKAQPLRPVTGGSNDYLIACLSRDGKTEKRAVHRLVLEAFVGPCPQGMEARHFPDRDVTNNRATNLKWGTHTQNLADRDFHGTSNKGERHGLAKLTDASVKQIRALRAMGYAQTKIGAIVGISQAQVHRVLSGECWSHVSGSTT